jgi:hypothetical protein
MEEKHVAEGEVMELVDKLDGPKGCFEHYPKDFEPLLDPNLVVGLEEEVVSSQFVIWSHSELP